MKKFSIAIDGPSASGKSTVAKILASKLGLLYVDTGAMYRAFTYACLKNNIDPKDEEKSCSLIGKIEISFNDENKITLDGIDVSKEIRENDVADNVSYIASYGKIREALAMAQRKIGEGRSVVMDGRDIGTNVLPHAEIKFFQIAEANERAKRRYIENQEKGIPCDFESILENVKKRDYIDSHRAHSPLKQAEDAIVIDTTFMSIDEVVNEMLKVVKSKGYIE